MSLEVLRPPTNGPAPGTDEANHVTAGLGKWLVAAALVLLRLNVVVGVRGLVLSVSRHHSRSLGRVSATRHGSKLRKYICIYRNKGPQVRSPAFFS